MELLPQLMVTGVWMPPTAPGTSGGGSQAADKLTRIWAEVGTRFGYRRFELSADGTGVQIEGATDDDAITIQPPLVQVRGRVQTLPVQFVDNAHTIFKVVAEQLGVHQFFNFGIQHIYHAPAPNRDGRAFVMGQLLMRSETDFAALERGGSLWAGVKFQASDETVQHTLLIEPLLADNNFLFLNLDTLFMGEIPLDAIKERASDAERYLTNTVASYLDGLG